MRLLFVADGRSPIALSWVAYFVQAGHEVHWVSTYPCQVDLPLASLKVIPAAFGEIAGDLGEKRRSGKRGMLRRMVPVRLRTGLRQWLGPLTLPRAAQRLRETIAKLQPDLIHALRIPYEGMLVTHALHGMPVPARPPVMISVWGNDLTLHARANPWMKALTRRVLQAADALHTDCQRDQRLAVAWGFSSRKPALVVPGNGGIRMDIFHPEGGFDMGGNERHRTQPAMEGFDTGGKERHPTQPTGESGFDTGGKERHPTQPTDGGFDTGDGEHRPTQPAPLEEFMIIQPRGVRSYVCNRAFFRAIPLVLRQFPQARFTCPGMAGEALAERWVSEQNIHRSVSLLPHQTRAQMADCFREAQVVVSPTTHDGTPNTLLEAMACGCFPVVGDIESLREWITPGVNGLLVDAEDSQAIAAAIVQALEHPDLRRSAASYNQRLVAERAEYESGMARAEAFYRGLIAG